MLPNVAPICVSVWCIICEDSLNLRRADIMSVERERERERAIPLGPLHTRAKSRDHENMRAQMTMSKGRPKTLPKSCSVIKDPQM